MVSRVSSTLPSLWPGSSSCFSVPASFFPTDPDENAASLANVAEVLFGCLDAVGAKDRRRDRRLPRQVDQRDARVGRATSATVIAIDPRPQPDAARDRRRAQPELELVEATSHEALPELDAADAIIIDGDHNYFTLSEELRLIDERTPGAPMPLLILHDIGWPLARRDAYYAPERIPAEHRQPLAHDTYLTPDEPGTAPDGMPFACVAEREGGPAERDPDRGRGLPRRAATSSSSRRSRRSSASASSGIAAPRGPARVAAVIAPWDRNPVLERLEANRIRHMVERYRMTRRLEIAVEREAPEREVLRSAGRLARLRARASGSRALHGRGRPGVHARADPRGARRLRGARGGAGAQPGRRAGAAAR